MFLLNLKQSTDVRQNRTGKSYLQKGSTSTYKANEAHSNCSKVKRQNNISQQTFWSRESDRGWWSHRTQKA